MRGIEEHKLHLDDLHEIAKWNIYDKLQRIVNLNERLECENFAHTVQLVAVGQLNTGSAIAFILRRYKKCTWF